MIIKNEIVVSRYTYFFFEEIGGTRLKKSCLEKL
jgi:hypothetical protein